MFRRLHDYSAILGFVTGFLGAVLAVELLAVPDATEVPTTVATADDTSVLPPASEDGYARFAFAHGLERSVLEPVAAPALVEAVREALPEASEGARTDIAQTEAPPTEAAPTPATIAQSTDQWEVIAPRGDVVTIASAYSSEAPQVDPIAYTAIAGWSYAEAVEGQHKDPILLRVPAPAREEAEASVNDRSAARSHQSRRAEPNASVQRTASRKIEAIWDHALPRERGRCYWNLVGELYFVCD
jgi:hypothetical protein